VGRGEPPKSGSLGSASPILSGRSSRAKIKRKGADGEELEGRKEKKKKQKRRRKGSNQRSIAIPLF